MEHGRLETTVLLLLGFSCLLCTGELLQLKVSDFCIGATSGICSLNETKSGRRDASNEAVSFTDIPTVDSRGCWTATHLEKEHQHGTLFVATFRCFLSATIQIFMLSFCFRCSPISTLFLKKGWRYLYLSMQWFYGIGNVERQMEI